MIWHDIICIYIYIQEYIYNNNSNNNNNNSNNDDNTARALVKNPKAWGPGSLKFLFLNAGKFTPQQAEGPSNS